MRANTRINFNEKIIYLKILQDKKIATVDVTNKFCITDLANTDREYEHRFKKAYTHVQKHSISFSVDGKYLAYSEIEQPVVRVINIKTNKLHHSFATHNNKIETLCFDPTSSYLIAGSTSGRVFLWNLFSTGHISRLSSFPEYTPNLFVAPITNYVSTACFSPSGNLVATTGYGGSIVITDIHTEVSPKRITPKHIRINALSFVGEDYLCAGNIEGGVDFIDLETSQIIKHFQTGFSSISSLCVSSCLKYLFVSANANHIALLSLQDKQILDTTYINLNSKTTNIEIDSHNNLYVSCEDGSVYIYDLFPQQMLELRIKTSSFPKAHNLLVQYPLLKESKLVQDLENLWTDAYDKAISYVEEKEYDEVKTSLKKFASIASKQKQIQEFTDLINHYERFKIAVKHENFALAYSMADNINLLKETTPYKQMEDIWNSAFLKAQAFIIREKTHHLFKVLEPFNKVNAKLCFIQVLVRQPELFLEFIRLINIKKYENIFKIAHQYSCLKEIDAYQKIIKESKTIYSKTVKEIYARTYSQAQEHLDELAHIPHLKSKFEKASSLFSLAQRLEKIYLQKNLINAYTLIDKNEILKKSSLSKKLEKEWTLKIKYCEKNALLGHTKEIKTILKDLINIKTRSQKIGMLFRSSYLTQIKFLILDKNISSLNAAFSNYIKIFSYDTELDNLIIKLKKDNIITIKLNQAQQVRKPRSLWLNITKGIIPDNILNEGL